MLPAHAICADRFREANLLEAWIDVEDGAIVGASYLGGGLVGSTTFKLGPKSIVVPGVPFEVLRSEPEGLTEIAVEGALAPGGGRYAGFGPWPTVAPGKVTAFIAALDGGPGHLAAFTGTPGDIGRVATAGETLPNGKVIGRFALNTVAMAGPGGALTFATSAEGKDERNAIYCRCPGPAH